MSQDFSISLQPHVIFPNDTDASKCVSSFFLVLTRFPRMWGRTPGAMCNQLSGKMLLPHHFGLTLSSLSLPAGPWCIFLIQTVQGVHQRPFVLPSLGACSFTVCIRPTRITVLVLTNLLFPPVLPWHSSLCGCVFWRKVLNRKPLLWVSALVLVRRARLGSQERWGCSVNGGSVDTFTLRASWSHTTTGLSSPLYLLSPWGCFRPRHL